MTIKTIGLGMTLVMLSACNAHTLAGMRERDPVLVADSQRTTVEIGSCIAKVSEKLGSANYIPNPEGATVTLGASAVMGGEVPLLNVDIKDRGQLRHVTLWMFKTIWSDNNRHQLDRLRVCL